MKAPVYQAGAITLAALCLVGVVTLVSRCAGSEEYVSGLPVEKVVIQKADGGTVSFDAEIAAKPMDIHVGLMFRKEMGKDRGMLFEFPGEPQQEAFWMKNTLIPLDIIFIAPDGRIVNIHRSAKPGDTTPLPSLEPVSGVLEVNGGQSDERGIKIGDKVVHEFFKGGK
ncbi:MAG: DUF192 domain-containing protein [Alphaproteobacteria bacterium]|nr:MAG: DUF192 domain-containing protein [Alphaproteobacteria bacterium]